MDRRTLALDLALVCCLVLAGCSAPLSDRRAEAGPWPDDPVEDRLGWENGYWYNESIDVDESDGLAADEREALVARTMARVERIRGLEFLQTVPVETVSRSAFRNRSRDTVVDTPRERWREQVWEAMLLVGEDRTVGEVRAELYGGSVLGYYSPGSDRIVVVVADDGTEHPVVDRATLAHELVHALQDQHFSFLGGTATRDAQLTHLSVTEGDANYVEALYEERCGAEWNCIDRPNRSSSTRLADRNRGLYLTVIFPYSDGPNFVHRIRQRGGWEAVNDLYRSPPTSTEQIIHPEAYPDDDPVDVRVPDRSGPNWERFSLNPATERAGETSVFAAFWFHRAIDRSSLRNGTGAYSTYNYSDPASAGWAGDAIVPYRSEGGENAYVWRLQWETDRDAREFLSTYRSLLVERLNATEVRDGVYRVPDSSPYGDAFRIDRHGGTVTIVNAPTVGQLDAVHPPAKS